MQVRKPSRLAPIIALALTTGCVDAFASVASSPRGQHDALPRYIVTDLGTQGGAVSFAMGINDRGWIDGFSNQPGDSQQHATLWRNGAGTDLRTLGGPNSGIGFWGQAPNRQGAIALTGETSTLDPNSEAFCASFNSFFSAPATRYQCRPAVWQNGTITRLPTFGGPNGTASQINDRGQVVGGAETASPDRSCTAPGAQVLQVYPALWEHGVIQRLPVVPGDTGGDANTINDRGQAAGGSTGSCSGHPAHAVLWDHGVATALGSLGGTAFDEAVDINNRAQVVGFSSLPGDVYFHGFYWERGSGMKDLGTLDGDAYSVAVRINGEGQIVGFSCDVNLNCRAVLWEDGAITDLNTLTAPGSPALAVAFGINSRGEIVGQTLTGGGQMHAFLARPEDLSRAGPRTLVRAASNERRSRIASRARARGLLSQWLRFGHLRHAHRLQ